MKVNKNSKRAVVGAKETGTAEHGMTSDMGYFLFLQKKEIEAGLNGRNRLYLRTVALCQLLWTRSLQNPSLWGLKRRGDGQRRRKKTEINGKG